MEFELRNGTFGPLWPCSMDFHPLTLLLGGERAGAGLLLRLVYFAANLRSLLQILWEREAEDGSQVWDQSKQVQNHLASAALRELLVGQGNSDRSGVVLLRWGTTELEVDVGAQVSIHRLEKGPGCLLFPKERIVSGVVRNPMVRASLGLPMELLQGSRSQLHPTAPTQIRFVELPELALDPEEQIAEVYRIAEWVNRGHWVILTTHSPLISQSIRNLVHASHLPRHELKGMPKLCHRIDPKLVGGFVLQARGPRPTELEDALQSSSSTFLEDQFQRIRLWVDTLRSDSCRPQGSER